jgi:16S rRNA (cytosine1402-N4)-methyltransferase
VALLGVAVPSDGHDRTLAVASPVKDARRRERGLVGAPGLGYPQATCAGKRCGLGRMGRSTAAVAGSGLEMTGAMAGGPGHRPVLLDEAIAWLAPRSGGRYLDGTFGGGGHSRAILAASAPDGRVLALDADPAAVDRGRSLAAEPAAVGRLTVVHANFADLYDVAARQDMLPLDGVLLDLGLSSFQLDAAERGFAFRFAGPLDMRFDPTQGRPASALVNELPERDLADLIYRYGEEPRSRRIAAAIVRERERGAIDSTSRLARIVESAVGGRRGADIHPATRTFQALRIAVNDELAALEAALCGAVDALAPGGRLVAIAFHSLEDRIVKQFIAHEAATCVCPPHLPVCVCGKRARLRKLTGAVKPRPAEVAANPRARSAVLRAAERLPEEDAPAAPRTRPEPAREIP